MTSGTKIFLAVFALFVGILIIYYGVLMPDGNPSTAVASAQRDAASSDPGPNDDVELQQTSQAADEPEARPTIQPAVVMDQSFNNVSSGLPGGTIDTQKLPPGALPLGHPDRVAMRNRPAPPSPSLPGSGKPQANPIAPVQIEPKPATTMPAEPAAPDEMVDYTVKYGDSMWTIAESWFGDRSKWYLIAKANPLVDPSRMQIGDKLKLPSKESAGDKPAAPKPKPPVVEKEPADADSLTYTVKPGDTLAKIARALYDEFYIWETIYELNKDAIGDDPAALEVGMKLKLPKPAKKSE